MAHKRKNPLGISWFWWLAAGAAGYWYLREEGKLPKKLDIFSEKGFRWVPTERGYACVETKTQKTVAGSICAGTIGPAPGTETLEGMGAIMAGSIGVGYGHGSLGTGRAPGFAPGMRRRRRR